MVVPADTDTDGSLCPHFLPGLFSVVQKIPCRCENRRKLSACEKGTADFCQNPIPSTGLFVPMVLSVAAQLTDISRQRFFRYCSDYGSSWYSAVGKNPFGKRKSRVGSLVLYGCCTGGLRCFHQPPFDHRKRSHPCKTAGSGRKSTTDHGTAERSRNRHLCDFYRKLDHLCRSTVLYPVGWGKKPHHGLHHFRFIL